MKLYLIRHGETTGDVENKYGGSYDDHLTEKGNTQIEVTAGSLVGSKVEIIFTSPLVRAKETAEIINNRIGSKIEVLEGIQERNYGILGGLTKDEAIKKYPEVVELHKDSKNTDPEGESYDDFNRRVVEAFELVLNRDYETVAVISHGGPIKVILKLLGMDIPDHIEDGEIIEIAV